jgi:hypothetical protein
VLRDVVVRHGTPNELVVVSQVPSAVDELMTLDLMSGTASVSLRVRVVESRPVLVAGALRHQVRLAVVEGESPRRGSSDRAPSAARA